MVIPHVLRLITNMSKLVPIITAQRKVRSNALKLERKCKFFLSAPISFCTVLLTNVQTQIREMSTRDEAWWEVDLSWGSDEMQKLDLPEEVLLEKLKNGEDSNLQFNTEFDVARRHCKVRIITSDIDNLSGSAVGIGRITRSKIFQHWAVVCEFKGGRTIMFELVNPSGEMVGGTILPRQLILQSLDDILFPPDVAEKGIRPPEWAEIGSIVTSPRKVWELVYNHKMNFKKYNAGKQNCQNWAMELLEGMSKSQKPDPRSCLDLVKADKKANLVPVGQRSVAPLVHSAVWSKGMSLYLSPPTPTIWDSCQKEERGLKRKHDPDSQGKKRPKKEA